MQSGKSTIRHKKSHGPLRPPLAPPPGAAPGPAAAALAEASPALLEPPPGPAEASLAPAEASLAPLEARLGPAEASLAPAEASLAPLEARLGPAEAPLAPLGASLGPPEAPLAPAEASLGPPERSPALLEPPGRAWGCATIVNRRAETALRGWKAGFEPQKPQRAEREAGMSRSEQCDVPHPPRRSDCFVKPAGGRLVGDRPGDGEAVNAERQVVGFSVGADPGARSFQRATENS